jgi:head-tail adaptor
VIVVRPGELEHEVRLERKIQDKSFDRAGGDTWEPVDTIWIGIRDDLPSRTERNADGMVSNTRRARVRMYWRDDVTADMRLVLPGENGAADRVMQIVAGPAELGRRGGLEVMVEDYQPTGKPA